MNLKKILLATAVGGALSVGVLGLGAAGTAIAAASPFVPGTPMPQQTYGQDGDVFGYGPGWFWPGDPIDGTGVWYDPGLPVGLNVPPISVTWPTLPTAPTLPTVPTVTLPTLPTVTLPTLPTLPTITLPTL